MPVYMSCAYHVEVTEFDSEGHQTGSARPFEITAAELENLGESRFDYVPEDLFWESRSTYDPDGNRTSRTDALGNTTYYTYDSSGNLLTTTDPPGNTTRNTYDSAGRLLTETDSAGNLTRYSYTASGRLREMVQVRPDGTERVLSTNQYDAKGRLSRMTDATGTVHRYSYDAGGNQTRHEMVRTDPQDPTVTQTIVTETDYDGEGRAVATRRRVEGDPVSSTSTEYGDRGQQSATVDRWGARTEYIYDARGSRAETRRQVRNAAGALVWMVSRSVYDGRGNVIWQTDPHVESDPDAGPQPAPATHTVYDALGRVVRTEQREGVLIEFDTSGRLPEAIVTDEGALISATAQAYDAAGRTAHEIGPTGVRTEHHYTASGRLDHTTRDLDGDPSTTDDRQVTSRTIFDDLGRTARSVTDPDGDLSTTADQRATRYVYDEQGRVVETHYADGTSTSTEYDELGRRVAETDQLGNTTRYEHDAEGRLTAVILPPVEHPGTAQMVHPRYEYEYDQYGNNTIIRDNVHMTDPSDPSTIDRTAARETTFTYDFQGRKTSRTLPEGQTEEFFYNDRGQRIRTVDFEDRVTVFEHDNRAGAGGRLAAKHFFENEAAWDGGNGTPDQTISYTYDAHGREVSVNDSLHGRTETEYDHRGRTTRVASPRGTVNYEHDRVTGQVTRTWTGEDGADPFTDIRYTYDRLGRLESVSTHAREGSALGTPDLTEYAYDVLGNLDQIQQSNGIITDYTYDVMNRLDTLTHYGPDGTPGDRSDNPVVQSFDYERQADGMKSGVTERDESDAESTFHWTYDNAGRLIEEIYDAPGQSLDYTTDYTFDLVGNRLQMTTDEGNDGRVDETVTYEYDDNDRLLEETLFEGGQAVEGTVYVYGSAGVATQQTLKRVRDLLEGEIDSETRMEYNLQGRLSKLTIESRVDGQLTKVVTQEYTYDDDGIKVTQTETVDEDADGVMDAEKVTEYLNDKLNHTGYSQVLEQHLTEDGTERITTFTIGHDVLSQFSSAAENTVLTLLADGHGNTRAVANDLGDIAQSYTYDAYGNAVGFDPAEALTNMLYSGEQYNPVSGLQYLRARWYRPQTGRFTRADPFAGNLEDPHSLHKYGYAKVNPVTYRDPRGLFVGSMTEFLSSTAILTILGSTGLGAAVGGILTGTWRGAIWGAIAGSPVGLAVASRDPGTIARVLGNGFVTGFGTFGLAVLADKKPVEQRVSALRGFAVGAWNGLFGGVVEGSKYRLVVQGITAFFTGFLASAGEKWVQGDMTEEDWKWAIYDGAVAGLGPIVGEATAATFVNEIGFAGPAETLAAVLANIDLSLLAHDLKEWIKLWSD